jgi:putative transposase
VKGRKRHLLVDTLGLVLQLVVHAADIQERDGAQLVLKRMKKYLHKLAIIWADGAYGGKLIQWAKRYYGWTIEMVKRSDRATGFQLLPKRWIVERTFSWFGNYRRLAKDYEYWPATSETMIYIAMIHLMVRRLA